MVTIKTTEEMLCELNYTEDIIYNQKWALVEEQKKEFKRLMLEVLINTSYSKRIKIAKIFNERKKTLFGE